jgi:hypothetical protein
MTPRRCSVCLAAQALRWALCAGLAWGLPAAGAPPTAAVPTAVRVVDSKCVVDLAQKAWDLLPSTPKKPTPPCEFGYASSGKTCERISQSNYVAQALERSRLAEPPLACVTLVSPDVPEVLRFEQVQSALTRWCRVAAASAPAQCDGEKTQ